MEAAAQQEMRQQAEQREMVLQAVAVQAGACSQEMVHPVPEREAAVQAWYLEI